MTPFTAAVFAWQAGTVFALRSLGLWGDPVRAQALLAEYAQEKQRAFMAGSQAAGRAALAGSDPATVLAAALRPAQRLVKANHRRLTTQD
jgi:hypothetical protein